MPNSMLRALAEDDGVLGICIAGAAYFRSRAADVALTPHGAWFNSLAAILEQEADDLQQQPLEQPATPAANEQPPLRIVR